MITPTIYVERVSTPPPVWVDLRRAGRAGSPRRSQQHQEHERVCHEQQRNNNGWNKERCAERAWINTHADLAIVHGMQEIDHPHMLRTQMMGVAHETRAASPRAAISARAAA